MLHDEEIRRKTKLGPEELRVTYAHLLKSIKTTPAGGQESGEYEKNLAVALKLAAHPEDAPYLAAALTLNCPVWSNDAGLSRQQKVPVITTAKLVETIGE